MLGLLTGPDPQQEDPNLHSPLCHPSTLAEEREISFYEPSFFVVFFFFSLLKELSSAGQGDPHHRFLPAHGGHWPTEVLGGQSAAEPSHVNAWKLPSIVRGSLQGTRVTDRQRAPPQKPGQGVSRGVQHHT